MFFKNSKAVISQSYSHLDWKHPTIKQSYPLFYSLTPINMHYVAWKTCRQETLQKNIIAFQLWGSCKLLNQGREEDREKWEERMFPIQSVHDHDLLLPKLRSTENYLPQVIKRFSTTWFNFEISLKIIRVLRFPYCCTFQSHYYARKHCESPKAGCK